MERITQDNNPFWPITEPLDFSQLGHNAQEIYRISLEKEIDVALSSSCASVLLVKADKDMLHLKRTLQAVNDHSRELAGYTVQLEEIINLDNERMFPDQILVTNPATIEQVLIDSQEDLSTTAKINLLQNDPSGISCLEAIALEKARNDPVVKRKTNGNITVGYVLAFWDQLHPYTRGRLAAFCHYQKVYTAALKTQYS